MRRCFYHTDLVQSAVFHNFSRLIIHLKKFLHSDWLREMQFLGNKMQNRGNSVQKEVTQCNLQLRYPKISEDHPNTSEDFRRSPNNSEDHPNISKGHPNTSEDFRRSPEHFRRFAKVTRILLKITLKVPKISEDHPNASEDFRRPPDHFREFLKTYDNLQRSFSSFGTSRAMPSPYHSRQCMVGGSIFSSVLLISNHMIFLVQIVINKHLEFFSKTTNCTRPTGSCNFVGL